MKHPIACKAYSLALALLLTGCSTSSLSDAVQTASGSLHQAAGTAKTIVTPAIEGVQKAKNVVKDVKSGAALIQQGIETIRSAGQ